MNKKSWKKKLLTEFIVFMVIMVVFALSFLTADNQRKQWIEDNGDEAGNFTQTFLSKGYIPEATETPKKPEEPEEPFDTSKDISINTSAITQNNTPTEASAEISVQAVEKSTVEKPTVEEPAEDTEVILEEPQVLHSSTVSPDSKYIAETYGVNENITAAGLYPSREIRIRELTTDQIVWSMTGSYSCNFLWTLDSRYLAVSYTARTYAETVIVDTKDFTTVMVPIPKQIEENMQEFRADVYLYAREWEEAGGPLIDYRYTGKDSMEHYGTFNYELSTGDIKEFQLTGTR